MKVAFVIPCKCRYDDDITYFWQTILERLNFCSIGKFGHFSVVGWISLPDIIQSILKNNTSSIFPGYMFLWCLETFWSIKEPRSTSDSSHWQEWSPTSMSIYSWIDTDKKKNGEFVKFHYDVIARQYLKGIEDSEKSKATYRELPCLYWDIGRSFFSCACKKLGDTRRIWC